MGTKNEVDMSPAAVRERLLLVNDLWLLSVKLMNSRKVSEARNSAVPSDQLPVSERQENGQDRRT